MKKILFLFFILVIFTSESFAKGDVSSDYIENGIKYFSKGHPKAFDLNVEVKYPSNWSAQEGLRPHIVQKFVSENGKGSEICTLLIQKMPMSFSSREWQEMSNDLKWIKDAFASENDISDFKSLSTNYSGIPGNLLEYNKKSSQAGLNMFSSTVQHVFYYKDKMITLTCMTVGLTKELANRNMKKVYTLFRLMGNDIILHNIYSDKEIFENIKETINSDNEDEALIEEIDQALLMKRILIGFLFTWGLGLFIPLTIRFVFKKRLSKGVAISVVSCVWLMQIFIAQLMANGGHANKSHTALLLVAMVGYSIIVKKEDDTNKKEK